MTTAEPTLQATGRVARRQQLSRSSRYLLLGATSFGIGVLVVLAWDVLQRGLPALDWEFLNSYPSRFADRAGLRSSILGSAWMVLFTVVLAIPLAVGTAIWMEEFAPRGRLLALVQLNIANLAGVPSIIYGILGLAVFVRFFDMGFTIGAGALTLTLMILPMTVIASSEAIRQVPSSTRDASLALGATRWQTVWHHVLPGALPGIMTGMILAVSRAAGETAALIMIGAASFIAFDNTGLPHDVWGQQFTTVPIQVYNWTQRPQEEFRALAAAAIIVMMVAIVGLNLIAVLIRERFRRYD
ncbi:MAG: phosphate ABC transporter permease PstA [Dehalococcoidia bacterium]|nr:phosphate ABC transporter permease PstA [Dehalococcoidia bacterium]